MPLFDYEDEIIDQGRIAQFNRQQRLERPRRIWRGIKATLPWVIVFVFVLPLIGQLIGLGSVHPVIETYIEMMRAVRVTIWGVCSIAVSFMLEQVISTFEYLNTIVTRRTDMV